MREKAEKLPRTNCPTEVRCRVALRQLGELFVDDVIAAAREERRLGKLLANSIEALRVLLGEEGDPQLDHDPQLEQREKVRDEKGKIVGYVPAEHDPDFLFYRWDHGIKTNVRGDHGQFSDVVIRKRGRRRKREPYVTPLGPKVAQPIKRDVVPAEKLKSKRIKSGGKSLIVHNRLPRPAPSGSPRTPSRAKSGAPKRKWANRPLRSKNTLRRKKRR